MTPTFDRLSMNLPLSSFAALSCATLLLAGCQTTPVPTARVGAPVTGLVSLAPAAPLDPALLQPATALFRIGPGDTLDIEVMGRDDTRASVTVGPDGKIYYYILNGLDVWGLTLTETRQRLGHELQQFLREKPVVAVSLRTVASQRVWVLGRINAPGVYVLSGPTTLLDAIAQGGGVAAVRGSAGAVTAPGGREFGAESSGGGGPEAADLSRAFVIRQGKILPIDFQKLLSDGDLSQNIYLQPDDFIFLPAQRGAEVHVLGAVTRPQSQKISGALTVARAVALAGGTAPNAFISNVAVLRGSLTRPQIAIVDLGAIVSGRTPDVRLERGDIVYVPYTPYRTLTRYADLILDSFARTIGVNAGAKAAGGEVASVGVNVTVGP